jgi:hypothetical protein
MMDDGINDDDALPQLMSIMMLVKVIDVFDKFDHLTVIIYHIHLSYSSIYYHLSYPSISSYHINRLVFSALWLPEWQWWVSTVLGNRL